MTPYFADHELTMYVGDVRDVLRELPDESVHCVVTSPPYWGLRDYGTASWDGGDPECDHAPLMSSPDPKGRPASQNGHASSAERLGRRECRCGAVRVDSQLGLEPTPEAYVEGMVAVFREVRRVLRKDGTLWLNLGDSYISGQGGRQSEAGSLRGNIRQDRPSPKARPELENAPSGWAERAVTPRTYPGADNSYGWRPKDLAGMPWRVAFALQADGWYLRSDIIWAKPNPMPESVTDRPTKAHEYLFLLTRSPRYYYDAEAIREPYAGSEKRPAHLTPGTGRPDIGYPGQGDRRTRVKVPGGWEVEKGAHGTIHRNGRTAATYRDKTAVDPNAREARQEPEPGEPNAFHPLGRNKRSVWTIATQPFPEAHFATFPEKLVEPCILAGSPERVCPECGAPWIRETKVEYDAQGRTTNGPRSIENRGFTPGFGQRLVKHTETTGWGPSCDHAEEPVRAVVLDPFGGSGTVALVANRLGRRAIHIDLSPEYADIALRRVRSAWEAVS